MGLWGTLLDEDSLHGKVQRHVRGAGISRYRVQGGAGTRWEGEGPRSLKEHAHGTHSRTSFLCVQHWEGPEKE